MAAQIEPDGGATVIACSLEPLLGVAGEAPVTSNGGCSARPAPQDEDAGDCGARSNSLVAPTATEIINTTSEETVAAELGVDRGIYVSVLVACFGGVKFEMGKGRSGTMHPAVLVVLCFMLFYAQANAILALQSDMKVGDPIYDEAEPRTVELLKIKLLMICILYILNMQVLVSSIQYMLFILNPVTWLEVKSSSHTFKTAPAGKLRWFMRHVVGNGRWAFIAILLRFNIGYWVCIYSVSVILGCDTVTDTIFNSLAITFIHELAGHWWDFCAVVLHLSPLEDYEFRLRTSVWSADGQLAPDAVRGHPYTKFMGWLVQKTSGLRLFGEQSCLRRGHGFRRLEMLLTFISLAVIYDHQFTIVLLAVDSKVLPGARDICAQWRLRSSLNHNWSNGAWSTVQKMMLVDVDEQLATKIDGLAGCASEEFRRTTTKDYWMLRSVYMQAYATCISFLTCFLLLPQILHAFCGKCLHAAIGQESADAEQEIEIEALKRKMREAHEALRRHEAEIEELRQWAASCASPRVAG